MRWNVCTNQTLKLIQNVRKQIDYKKPSNTEQMNRVQNNWNKVLKCKALECLRIKIGKFDVCSVCF